MRKTVILTALAATAALAALPARAGDVQWSVGINAPVGYGSVGTVISNGPVYAPAPVYVEPAPVYVAPAPVYVAPPPRVIYAPPPVYVRPAPVVYGAPVYVPAYGGHWHHRYHDGRYHDGRHYDGSYYDGRYRSAPPVRYYGPIS
jgi:hypothetical protein